MRRRLQLFGLEPAVRRPVPGEIARRHMLLPLSLRYRVLQLAMADTFDVVAIGALERATDLPVDVVSAAQREIETAIDRYFRCDLPGGDHRGTRHRSESRSCMRRWRKRASPLASDA